ncbi:MAG: hypothetical protein ACYS9T_10575 [Planctomycetota bacterium]
MALAASMFGDIAGRIAKSRQIVVLPTTFPNGTAIVVVTLSQNGECNN